MEVAKLHTPVMLQECLDLLRPAFESLDSKIYVDCTLGMAGHAVAVLQEFPKVHLVGIDRDSEALALAKTRLEAAGFTGRFTLVHTTYDQIQYALSSAGVKQADGILMDLGLSSFQIDTRERGFSYSVDSPLDMRMNSTDDSALTAAEILNTWQEVELARIFSRYGEEKYSKSIARNIVKARQEQPFENSGRLVSVIENSIPAKARYSGSHPAKRVFQALRIAVNEELEILDDALQAALASLAVGGRLVIESYHSLEDRMVKQTFAAASTSTAPPGLPIDLAQFQPDFKLVTRGAILASETEQLENSRSKSVRLRAIQKLKTTSTSTPNKSTSKKWFR